MKTPSTDAAEFASLGLSSALVGAVAALGYEEPTPIQREAIPVLLSGGDMLGQAATGEYRNPVAQETMEMQIDLAIREATDLELVPPAYRARLAAVLGARA